MILNVLVFKNEKIGAFTAPHFIDIEPQKAAVQLARSMKLDLEKATPYQNLTMWSLGTFDDEKGVFTLEDEPVLLLDCRAIWKGLKDELLRTSENTQARA